MEIPKLLILLSFTYHSFASEHSHTIPIEGYETELQDLGQHIEIPETPVKVIKITKTIAVKIPVPYPVKVREKVPYPVHVSKPYPVPVPQIIHVPHAVAPKTHNEHDASDTGHGGFQNSQHGGHEGLSYEVQETPANGGHSFLPLQESQHFNGNADQSQHYGASDGDEHSSGALSGNSYGAPSTYYGHSDSDGDGSAESKSYDQAINKYLQKYHPSSGNSGNSGYHYH